MDLVVLDNYLQHMPGWTIHRESDMPMLNKIYDFPSYRRVLDFVNAVGHAAELENHHPRLLVDYKSVAVFWWTHVIGGVHANDLAMAGHCDKLYGMVLAGHWNS